MTFCTMYLNWRNTYEYSLYKGKFVVDFMELVRSFGNLPFEAISDEIREEGKIQKEIR